MANPSSGGSPRKAAARKERRQLARETRRRELQHERRTAALKRVGGWGAAVAVILAVVVFVVRTTGAGVSYSGDLRTGGKLEALSLPQLAGAGTISYASFADKPVVLNYFASWCEFSAPRCRPSSRFTRHSGRRLRSSESPSRMGSRPALTSRIRAESPIRPS